jgi:hypothetical protein
MRKVVVSEFVTLDGVMKTRASTSFVKPWLHSLSALYSFSPNNCFALASYPSFPP